MSKKQYRIDDYDDVDDATNPYDRKDRNDHRRMKRIKNAIRTRDIDNLTDLDEDY